MRNGLIELTSEDYYGLPGAWRARDWQEACFKEFRRKERASEGADFSFLIYAGVGSGKTSMAATIASYRLNKRRSDLVIYVCPNRLIMSRVKADFKAAKMPLRSWKAKSHGDGVRNGDSGFILTYQALIRDHAVIGRIVNDKTLVIFDEIHHLGDNLSWGDSARDAFQGRAGCIVGLSGTPFRGDNREIPFVRYDPIPEEGIRRFKPDFVYTLGRSVKDGVCRKPVFHPLGGDVDITFPDGTRKVCSFEKKLPVNMANRRLCGAVLRGSVSRANAIARAVEFCRRHNRKLIIFVGGDTRRKDFVGIRDAVEFLPAELRALGIHESEICTVTSEDSDAPSKIKSFGSSKAWILTTVNMVSEGVDIPELSVALFLTSITGRATTIQRIGRILRGQGDAHIFMFADPRNREIAAGIEAEISHEIDLGKISATPSELVRTTQDDGDRPPLAIGLSSYESGIIVGGVEYSEAARQKYLQVLDEYDLPAGDAHASIIFPLIVKGVYGPLNEGGAA